MIVLAVTTYASAPPKGDSTRMGPSGRGSQADVGRVMAETVGDASRATFCIPRCRCSMRTCPGTPKGRHGGRTPSGGRRGDERSRWPSRRVRGGPRASPPLSATVLEGCRDATRLLITARYAAIAVVTLRPIAAVHLLATPKPDVSVLHHRARRRRRGDGGRAGDQHAVVRDVCGSTMRFRKHQLGYFSDECRESTWRISWRGKCRTVVARRVDRRGSLSASG